MSDEREKRRNKKDQTPRASRGRFSLRRRRQKTSVFFLLWSTISLLTLLVVLAFSFAQRGLFTQSYKEQAASELSLKGEDIRFAVEHPPQNIDNNYNGYLHSLNRTFDVNILILDEEGNLIFPNDENEISVAGVYKKEAQRLLKKLQNSGGDSVVYEGDGQFVYGAVVEVYGSARYLHASKSLHFMQTSLNRMNTRTVLLSVTVFILSFALAGAVSGWLVHPISELTGKARKLAEGDFNIDFHGNDYGKELVELAESLNFARDELSKTDRMQRELIANVSHDFKTPLTMIKGYASMIIEISGDSPEKRNKHAQIIVDEADRLASLVTDVLDLSKIRSGIDQLQETDVNMSEYLYEVLDRFAYLRDTQGYQFIVDVEEYLYTRADKTKIGQVLYNLIGNAVNYTGEDKKVYVSLKREGDRFRFSVRDTGVGIKREELSGIWERYYRSAEAHKRPVKGTGLGLSIVKSVLERHGFIFGVESEVGKGSIFYVVFPIID